MPFVKLLNEKLVGNTVCKKGDVIEIEDARLYKAMTDVVAGAPEPAGVKDDGPATVKEIAFDGDPMPTPEVRQRIVQGIVARAAAAKEAAEEAAPGDAKREAEVKEATKKAAADKEAGVKAASKGATTQTMGGLVGGTGPATEPGK